MPQVSQSACPLMMSHLEQPDSPVLSLVDIVWDNIWNSDLAVEVLTDMRRGIAISAIR